MKTAREHFDRARQQKRWDEAVDHYVSVVEIDSQAVYVFFDLGYALYKTGDLAAARDILEVLLTWDDIDEGERSEAERIIQEIDSSIKLSHAIYSIFSRLKLCRRECFRSHSSALRAGMHPNHGASCDSSRMGSVVTVPTTCNA